MNRLVGMLAASVCLVASSSAAAQEMSPAGTMKKGEREGIFGRIGLDTGYMSTSAGERDYSIGGIGTGLNLQAGYMIIPNLALFGEFNYQTALSLSGTDDEGNDLPDAFLEDTSMSYLSVGPGVAYFLANDIFLQGSLLYSSTSVSSGDSDSDPFTGFGFRVGAGKDFRMSDDFLLGVGANFFYGILSQTVGEGSASVDVDANAMSFGLTLSASYN